MAPGPMLDAYIIDEIRKEQERRREQDQRPRLHIEPPTGVNDRRPPKDSEESEDEGESNGIIRIDL